MSDKQLMNFVAALTEKTKRGELDWKVLSDYENDSECPIGLIRFVKRVQSIQKKKGDINNDTKRLLLDSSYYFKHKDGYIFLSRSLRNTNDKNNTDEFLLHITIRSDGADNIIVSAQDLTGDLYNAIVIYMIPQIKETDAVIEFMNDILNNGEDK